ncbi:MAG: transposon-encoded TnpW family protein [Raoultibacter sp.]
MTSQTTQSLAPSLVRKQNIGNTLYIVNVHFNPASKESVEDKMKRIIQSECQKT